MISLDPYLNFNGDCAEAFRFYAELLGGEIGMMSTYGDIPGEEQPAELKDRVMHVRMTVGDSVIMGSDSPPEYFEKPQGLWVSINVDEVTEAERIWSGLSAGGTVTMPLEKTFWAAAFGMCVDRFGTPWMVNCQGSSS